MLIVFTDIETKIQHRYCVEYVQKDGIKKIVIFGKRQKKQMLEYVSVKLSDNFITNLKIKKL